MRDFAKYLAGFVAASVLLIVSFAAASMWEANHIQAVNLSRACMLETGGWTVIDCSAAAAYSAKLTGQSRYLFQSTADDTYLSFHSAGSGGDADANDLELDGGDVVDFVVSGAAPYATCDGNAGGNGGKIKYKECR